MRCAECAVRREVSFFSFYLTVLEFRQVLDERPTDAGVPVVGERADQQVLAGASGRPYRVQNGPEAACIPRLRPYKGFGLRPYTLRRVWRFHELNFLCVQVTPVILV